MLVEKELVLKAEDKNEEQMYDYLYDQIDLKKDEVLKVKTVSGIIAFTVKYLESKSCPDSFGYDLYDYENESVLTDGIIEDVCEYISENY